MSRIAARSSCWRVSFSPSSAAACAPPGPWQFSQPTPAKLGRCRQVQVAAFVGETGLRVPAGHVAGEAFRIELPGRVEFDQGSRRPGVPALLPRVVLVFVTGVAFPGPDEITLQPFARMGHRPHAQTLQTHLA